MVFRGLPKNVIEFKKIIALFAKHYSRAQHMHFLTPMYIV